MQYAAIFKTVVKTDRLCVKKSGAPDKDEDDDNDPQPDEVSDDDALFVAADATLFPVFPLEMHPRAKRNNNSIPGALP